MAALGEMKGMKTMDDFISRKALLERLDNRTRTAYPNELYGLMLAHDYISDAPAVETGSKWIPVTERLPEDEELVLIHCKNGAMFVGYCGKQYCDYERRWRIKTALNSTKLLNLGRVTHWMPLPEPPKGE